MPDTQTTSSSNVRARTIAVIGATGAVGAEMVACLETRAFPIKELRLLASPRSAGKTVRFRGKDIAVAPVSEEAFAGVDVALFAASSGVSRQYAPAAVKAGALVVDNSSAFRMDANTPLVVPEVNGDALRGHQGVIANPNCTAAIMVMALWPLHQVTPIRRVIASTYQAASGAGAAAMRELEESTRAYLAGAPFEPKVLPHPYAFNLFSHNAEVNLETGYNDEENKVIQEMRKIMGAPDLRIGVTCVRVPVLRAHCMTMSVEFARPFDVEEARALLSRAPGVRVVDDRARNYFPMPIDSSGGDDVLVGRLRADLSDPDGRSLMAFVSGDQLRKGAALNAVQIAERVW